METCLFIKLQLFQMKLATTSEEVVEFLSGGELWGNGGTAALLSKHSFGPLKIIVLVPTNRK